MIEIHNAKPALFVPTDMPQDGDGNHRPGFGLGLEGSGFKRHYSVTLKVKEKGASYYPTWDGKVYEVLNSGRGALAWLTDFSKTQADEKVVPPETEIEITVCDDATPPNCVTVTVPMPAGPPPPPPLG